MATERIGALSSEGKTVVGHKQHRVSSLADEALDFHNLQNFKMDNDENNFSKQDNFKT